MQSPAYVAVPRPLQVTSSLNSQLGPLKPASQPAADGGRVRKGEREGCAVGVTPQVLPMIDVRTSRPVGQSPDGITPADRIAVAGPVLGRVPVDR